MGLIGTAVFIKEDASDQQFVLRVHNNCLFSRGQFNLLSVSKVCQKEGNGVDLSLSSPALLLGVSGVKQRKVGLPLFMEDGLFVCNPSGDGLFAIGLPKAEVTPGGGFRVSDQRSSHRWDSKILATASPNQCEDLGGSGVRL
jgi:hypothetical protein